MKGSCWLLCWGMLYIFHNQLSTWLSVESAQVWRWLPLGCWSQQWNTFPHRSCPPPAIPPVQTSPLSPSAVSTASEPNACAGSVKKPLDPGVQLHHCKTHSYKASGSSSGFTPQGRSEQGLYIHMTPQLLCPWSDNMRPCCKGLSAPKGKYSQEADSMAISSSWCTSPPGYTV